MRLDKYLKVSRLIKRRTVANEACDGGRVMINDKPAKASTNVKEGDIITIDVASRTMNVELSDEELAKRKANFSWTFPAEKYPRFLRLFVKNVGSMAKGGIWE